MTEEIAGSAEFEFEEPPRTKQRMGAFQIYTGEGKGKSTASLGLML